MTRLNISERAQIYLTKSLSAIVSNLSAPTYMYIYISRFTYICCHMGTKCCSLENKDLTIEVQKLFDLR